MQVKMAEQAANKDGFIAALDQSGGSTPKALKLYGVDESQWSNDKEMFDLIHQMRARIIKSPAFTGDKVMGAILFEQTMDREGIAEEDRLRQLVGPTVAWAQRLRWPETPLHAYAGTTWLELAVDWSELDG